MLYKTIVHELLKQNRPLHNRLRHEGTILEALDYYATELKTSHEEWKERLALSHPERAPEHRNQQASELALSAMVNRLSSVSAGEPDHRQPVPSTAL